MAKTKQTTTELEKRVEEIGSDVTFMKQAVCKHVMQAEGVESYAATLLLGFAGSISIETTRQCVLCGKEERAIFWIWVRDSPRKQTKSLDRLRKFLHGVEDYNA